MTDPSGIDIVTRLYDLADLPLLDRLVFSLVGQAGAVPLRLHLMLQRFSFVEVQAVRNATAALRPLTDHVSIALHNWDYPAPFALAVPLLNYGLEVARGRYFTCLDIHDELRPNACMTLLARLKASEATIALGGSIVRPVWWWGDVVVAVPDKPSLPASANAFLIDRSRLSAADCVFRNTAPGGEIREFVRAISRDYEVDAAHADDILLVRYVVSGPPHGLGSGA